MSALLSTRMVAKPWGRLNIPEAFGSLSDQAIGEVWFEPEQNFEEILVKFLFTSEKLSVQAHPSASDSPTGRGKEECWLILDAEPGAQVALGFREEVTSARIERAARDGSLEDMLAWFAVTAGDFFYVPAGTVHAMGPGLSLVEVQQNTDITYRLYDYGRPRELHLDAGLTVAHGGAYPTGLRQAVDPERARLLVDGPQFRLAQFVGMPNAEVASLFTGPLQLVPLSGTIELSDRNIALGQSAVVESLDEVRSASGARWLAAMPRA